MTQDNYYRGSRVRKVKPPNASQLPAQPTSLSASDGADAFVAIIWTAADRATSYHVYRSLTAGQQGSLIATVIAPSYSDTTAVLGSTYWYMVEGVNSYGSGPLSTQDSGYIETPPAPVGSPSGLTYYVSSSLGNNLNSGLTEALPWRTLAKLSNVKATFRPGDTILLKRGDAWTETFNLIGWPAGSAGLPITVGAYGVGSAPLINGEKLRDHCLYSSGGLSYYTIEDLAITNASVNGMYLTGNVNNVIVNRLYSEKAGRACFSLEASAGGSPNNMSSVELNDCLAHLAGTGNLTVYSFGFQSYHVYGGVTLRRCKSTYAGQGSSLGHGFNASSCSNVNTIECEACFTNINPVTGLDNGNNGEGHGIVHDDFADNCSILRSYSHDNQSAGIAGAHQSNDCSIGYNVLANNGRYGIVINGGAAGSDNPLIYNNTIYGTVAGNGIDLWGASSGAIIKNNIIANCGGYGIATANAPIGYNVATNIIYNNASGVSSGVSGATGTITNNPLFIEAGASNGSPGINLALQAGSPGINAGLNLGATYQIGLDPASTWPGAVATLNQDSHGAGWEIGAFVYP